MTDDLPLEDDVKRHLDRRRAVRSAWKYAAVLMVALVLIAVLSTLLWVKSSNDVDKLAQSNDSQIDQFEYCKKAPKTDPKCQEPVSEPAAKVVEGPPGIQGDRGIEGPEGPQGPPGVRGPQGLPGNSPRCLLEPSRCVGASGPSGKNGVDGKDGATGAAGKDGADGKDGESIKGDPGTPGTDGKDGVDGKDGAPGPLCPEGYTSRDVIIKEADVETTIRACVLPSPPPAN